MSILNQQFFQMSNAIFCYGLKPIQLAVYSYLRCCAGKKETCFPRMKTIAACCSCSESAAREAIRELERAAKEGYGAVVLFVVQLEEALYFAPNDDTQPEFGKALLEAQKAGVRLIARCCEVTPLSLTLGKEIPIRLK